VPLALLPERWALTPPFHPCLRRVPFEDVPKVCLRAITGIRSAGGLFSVALSVNSSTGFRLCSFPVCTFVLPRGHRLKPALPLPWRYQARCPCPDDYRSEGLPSYRSLRIILRSCSSRAFTRRLHSRSGVRTFLPPALRPPLGELRASQRSSSSPAILIITRESPNTAGTRYIVPAYFNPTSFSNSPSVKIVTPNSFALSYFDPGSVPTTT
jgi:hypothetical protein